MKPTSNRSGGLLVLLNKPRARTEVAGDKSAALIRFYGCLRDWPEGLIDRLQSIAYTVESFAWACEASDDPDLIESAARFLVRNRFSRGTRQGFRVVRLTPRGTTWRCQRLGNDPGRTASHRRAVAGSRIASGY